MHRIKGVQGMIQIIWHDTDTEMIIDATVIKGLKMWMLDGYLLVDASSNTVKTLAYIKLFPGLSTTQISDNLGITRSKVARLRKKYSDTLATRRPISKDVLSKDPLPLDDIPSHPLKSPSKDDILRASKDSGVPKVGINQRPDEAEVAALMTLDIGAVEAEIQAEMFLDHYDSCGWVVGKNKPMKKWRSAVKQWLRRRGEFGGNPLPANALKKNECSVTGCTKKPVASYGSRPYCGQHFDEAQWY